MSFFYQFQLSGDIDICGVLGLTFAVTNYHVEMLGRNRTYTITEDQMSANSIGKRSRSVTTSTEPHTANEGVSKGWGLY